MINLLYAGNDATFKGVLLSLISVTKYHKGPLNVFVFSADLTELNEKFTIFSNEHINSLQNYLQSINPDSKVTLIDVREKYVEKLYKNRNSESKYTPYTLIRLLADQYPQIPDKLLYLDYDVILYGDIQEMFDIDITNYEFAGAKDYYGRFFINPRYINAGVLLFNIKLIRQTGLFERSINQVNNKKMLLPDQSALNKQAKKKLILKRRFNEQHKRYDDTLVRHFSMTIKFFPKFKTQNVKPWDKDRLHNILGVYDLDDILEIHEKLLSE